MDINRSDIERAIARGLRAAIATQGPISFELVGSAAKRAGDEVLSVVGGLDHPVEAFDLDAFDLRVEELDLQLAGERV